MMGEARWWRGKKSWRGQWERKSFPESSVKRRFAKTGALKNHFKFFCVCACLTCCILTHTQASCGMKWFVSAMHKTLVRTVNDLFHGVKRTRKQLKWFGHRHAKFHCAHKIFMKIHFNLFIYLQQSAHYFSLTPFVLMLLLRLCLYTHLLHLFSLSTRRNVSIFLHSHAQWLRTKAQRICSSICCLFCACVFSFWFV